MTSSLNWNCEDNWRTDNRKIQTEGEKTVAAEINFRSNQHSSRKPTTNSLEKEMIKLQGTNGDELYMKSFATCNQKFKFSKRPFLLVASGKVSLLEIHPHGLNDNKRLGPLPLQNCQIKTPDPFN